MRRLAIVISLLSVLAALSGCIASDAPFFTDSKAATPLPARFILYGKSSDGEQAWRVERKGDAYDWQIDNKITHVRFVPLGGKDVRKGFHVAVLMGPDDDLMYGLVEIGPDLVTAFVFDADNPAQVLKVPFDTRNFSTRFANSADLVTVFRYVAARMPAGASGPVADPDADIRATRLEVFDLADPARRKEGETRFMQSEIDNAAKATDE